MTEAEFLAALRRLPLHPGAHGLADDTATLGPYTITTDTLVEGVHFLPADPADDVAWKLVATNLSDLAAKGATPHGVTLNHPLTDDAWDRRFLAGLAAALAALDCPLLGGDTVSLPPGAPRVLTLTAFGIDATPRPRSGAKEGDALYVTGTIGDAGAGLRIAQGTGTREDGPATLLAAYRRPRPRIEDGRLLAPHAHAMMDVSDGLLIDAARMAVASGLGATIALDMVPLSQAYRDFAGDDPLMAATAGDDYQLLFAAPATARLPLPVTRIGRFDTTPGLRLTHSGTPVALPASLGFEHATPRLR